VKNKYHILFRAFQILHKSTGKHLDEINTSGFKKDVSAMRKAPYSDNYSRQLVSAFKGVALYLAEQGHDISPDKVNKVKLPKRNGKQKQPRKC
jgi:hypothetical protein